MKYVKRRVTDKCKNGKEKFINRRIYVNKLILSFVYAYDDY